MSLRSKWAAGKAVRAGLAVEGAYLDRYVTDEQRGRRPIFNATLRAAASWLFFRVARSARMNRDMGAALRVGAAPAPRRFAGSLNRTSAIRLVREGGET